MDILAAKIKKYFQVLVAIGHLPQTVSTQGHRQEQ